MEIFFFSSRCVHLLQLSLTGMANNYTIIIKFIAYWAHRCEYVDCVPTDWAIKDGKISPSALKNMTVPYVSNAGGVAEGCSVKSQLKTSLINYVMLL